MDTEVQKKVFYNKFSPSSISYSAYLCFVVYFFLLPATFASMNSAYDMELNVDCGNVSVDWNNLAKGRARLQAVVNTVVNSWRLVRRGALGS
jgi:hypothetical protein